MYETDTDDGTTLPPSSPMDAEAMGKMVTAFETHTVEDNAPQEIPISAPILQDQEREAMIPIIIIDVDTEAPSAVETPASSTLSACVQDGQLEPVAPAVYGAVINTIPVLLEMEKTPHLSIETYHNFVPAPSITEPLTTVNPTALLLNPTPLTRDEHFAAPHQPRVVNNSLSPNGNFAGGSESVSSSASASTQFVAPTPTEVTHNKSTIGTARSAQQKNSKPKVLKEGQRNLKNKGVHQCPVPGCTETSTRWYDLRTRHIITAHPEEAIRLGLDKSIKARGAQPEGASKLDSNRNMMPVDAKEESKLEQIFRCPSCFHPYSRRDALVRHAESIINPQRKNKPSCNLTVEEVRSLRKKFKAK